MATFKPDDFRSDRMRGLILAVGIAALPTFALAQSPDLEKTCEQAAKDFFLTDRLTVGIVQSFPELKPPGVRFTYSTRQDAAKADITDIFECQFENPAAPYHLTRFCVSDTCYSSKEEDAERKRRFAEIRDLLDRPGQK
jgi:hypothetical protein